MLAMHPGAVRRPALVHGPCPVHRSRPSLHLPARQVCAQASRKKSKRTGGPGATVKVEEPSAAPASAPPSAPRRPVTTEEPEREPEELSTSGRPVEPEAVVTPAKPEPAPAETVQDVAQIVQAVQAAAAEPARRRGDDGLLSEDDIRRLATQRRQQAKAANLGFIDGIKEEVQLIEWPKPVQALLDTLVVIALVGSLAGFLFVVNAVLAEGSRRWYDLPINLDKAIAVQIWESFTRR